MRNEMVEEGTGGRPQFGAHQQGQGRPRKAGVLGSDSVSWPGTARGEEAEGACPFRPACNPSATCCQPPLLICLWWLTLPTHPHKMAQPPFLPPWFPPSPRLLPPPHLPFHHESRGPLRPSFAWKASKRLIYLRLSLHPQSSVLTGQQSKDARPDRGRSVEALPACDSRFHRDERQRWVWEPRSHKEEETD